MKTRSSMGFILVWHALCLPQFDQLSAAEPIDEGAVEIVPLPQWTAEDLTRFNNGEVLITGALFEAEQQPELPPEVLDLPRPDPTEDVEVSPTLIPETALAVYFHNPPQSVLLDPQNILSQQEYLDTQSFLLYHSSDSKIDMRVYLFDRQQTISPNFDIPAMLRRNAQEGRETAAIFYYIGAPERSELHLSANASRLIGEIERRSCLQSSIQAAALKSQPTDQLESFCVEMSLKIYRLEKAIASGKDLSQSAMAANAETLITKPTRATKMLALWQTFLAYVLPVGSTMVVAVVAWLINVQRKQRMQFTFEEDELDARLGGVYGAAAATVISYALKDERPKLRQGDMPDFLGRS